MHIVFGGLSHITKLTVPASELWTPDSPNGVIGQAQAIAKTLGHEYYWAGVYDAGGSLVWEGNWQLQAVFN